MEEAPVVTFEVKSEARDDLREAARYYEGQQFGLGAVFMSRVFDAYTVIERQPQAFSPVKPAVRGREIRFYIMRQFPYSVVYELLPGRIVVLAVAHHKRRPGWWRRRLTP